MTTGLGEKLFRTEFMLSCLLVGQVFNNESFHVFGPLSLGEIITLIVVTAFLLFKSMEELDHRRKIGILAVGLFFLYWVCAAATPFGSQAPVRASNFLGTVTMQFLAILIVFLYLKKRHLPGILWYLSAAAFLVSLINIINAFPGEFNILQVRENSSRFGSKFGLPLERVVSITNIYGQLGVFLNAGLFCGLARASFNDVGGRSFKKGILVFGFSLVVVMGILSLQSRASAVGLFVGLGVTAFFMVGFKIRVFFGVLAVVISLWNWDAIIYWVKNIYVSIVSMQASTVSERIAGYREGASIISDNMFGVGQGAFGIISGEDAVLHNTFLDAFVSTGWFGGLALLSYIAISAFLLVNRAFQKDQIAILFLGAVVSGFVILNLYTGLTEYFFWLLVMVGIKLGCSVPQAHGGDNFGFQGIKV